LRRVMLEAVTALVALGALGAAGCSGSEPPPPQVEFAAEGSTVTANPTQYCDVNVRECQAYPQAAVTLRVPPGKPLEVSVPGPVSEAPWQVVFRYRAKNGTSTQARSTVFGAGERSDYTLVLPDGQAQLETVEVQQFGAAMVPREDGVNFATRATWVLSVDDRA
jgi:Protein of unknown function (DUF2771)